MTGGVPCSPSFQFVPFRLLLTPTKIGHTRCVKVKEAATTRASRGEHTLVLHITEEHYASIIDDPQHVRSEWLEPL